MNFVAPSFEKKINLQILNWHFLYGWNVTLEVFRLAFFTKNFLPNFEFKIFQNFKISQAKITK